MLSPVDPCIRMSHEKTVNMLREDRIRSEYDIVNTDVNHTLGGGSHVEGHVVYMWRP